MVGVWSVCGEGRKEDEVWKEKKSTRAGGCEEVGGKSSALLAGVYPKDYLE